MLDTSFAALVPVICVTLAALAAMLMEAFRRTDEQLPIGLLATIGLATALAACVVLWDDHESSFGLILADNFGLFASATVLIVGLLTVALSGPAIEREGLPSGEYYAAML